MIWYSRWNGVYTIKQCTYTLCALRKKVGSMSNSVYFFLAVGALLLGYIVYGGFVARVFGVDPERVTPALSKTDGVDFVPMSTGKIWLIQLLNIAGVGPIFGPILGALYGPAALVWIVIGSIFAGAVHDYMSGMFSLRYGGITMPDMVGRTLGSVFKQIVHILTIPLLILVGVVFVTSPAKLLTTITPSWMNEIFWCVIIFIYYFFATLMPIDKLIGRIYPFFGAALLIMAVGIGTMLFVDGYELYPAAQWVNQHPKELPLWPLMFITIACGAVSGFHSTQSPLMARCLSNERLGKPVFYGSMIVEGFIALIWATVGMSFYQSPEMLQEAIAAGGPGKVVADTSYALMGTVGGMIAILGVIVLPITSGDTALRAARLTLAEICKLPQQEHIKRLYIAVPLFLVCASLTQIDFNILWRYFGWTNQTLAAIFLWAAAAYLYTKDRFHWICSLPAAFMTAVIVSYICFEKTMGFGIDVTIANGIGIAAAVIALIAFLKFGKRDSIEE